MIGSEIGMSIPLIAEKNPRTVLVTTRMPMTTISGRLRFRICEQDATRLESGIEGEGSDPEGLEQNEGDMAHE